MRYPIIAALAFMLSLSLPVAAQDYENGLQAYIQGDHSIVSVLAMFSYRLRTALFQTIVNVIDVAAARRMLARA